MAKGIADTNVALGFAGVVLVLAVVAAFSMDLLVPAISGDDAEEQVVQADAETEAAPEAKPTPVATSWADDGGVADDWGADATSTAGNASGFASNEGPQGDGADGFDEAPSEAENARGGPSQARANRGGGASSVRSGAAPGAPDVSPPGGRGSDTLTQR